MKKIQIITIISAILFLNIFNFPQSNENWIRKPIKFSRTERTVTVKGTVLAKKLVNCYMFKGKEKQRITTSITSDRNNSSFALMEQDGDPAPYTRAPDGSSYVRSYNGVLHTNTIYEICVSSDSGRSNYTLEVTLE